MSTFPALPNLLPTILKPIRSLDGIVADAVVEEVHEDDVILTDHPVEQGATISDHAYKLPAQVVVTYVWSGGSKQNTIGDATFLSTIYQKIVQLEVNRTLFQLFTGKRAYQNMVITSIAETTDKTTENLLQLRITCREVLIATTQIAQVSGAAQQALPNKTAPIVNQGNVNLTPAPNFNNLGNP